jgi:competence protein ComFC
MHICSECFREFSPFFHKIKLGNIEVLSIYVYDETIRDKLYRLKGCHDIELAPVFLDYFLIELALR